MVRNASQELHESDTLDSRYEYASPLRAAALSPKPIYPNGPRCSAVLASQEHAPKSSGALQTSNRTHPA
jgi:hypothetical protein